MKKFLSLAVALIALTGCDIEGQLKVSQPTTMIAKDGGQLVLQPGMYNASVEAGDNKLKLKVHVNGKDKKVTIRTQQDLPSRNGDIFVPSAQSGQPFDAVGSVRTDVSESGRMLEWEACTTYDRRWVCHDVIVGHDRYGNPIIQHQCADEVVPVPGQQQVEYHNEITRTAVDIQFVVAGGNAELSRFTGAQSTTQQIVDYRGICR